MNVLNVLLPPVLLVLCQVALGEDDCPLVLNARCECPTRLRILCERQPLYRLPHLTEWGYANVRHLILREHRMLTLRETDLMPFRVLRVLDLRWPVGATCVVDDRLTRTDVIVYGLCREVSVLSFFITVEAFF